MRETGIGIEIEVVIKVEMMCIEIKLISAVISEEEK